MIKLLADLFKIISKLPANLPVNSLQNDPPPIEGVPSGPPHGGAKHRRSVNPLFVSKGMSGSWIAPPTFGGWPKGPMGTPLGGGEYTLERLAGGIVPRFPPMV